MRRRLGEKAAVATPGLPDHTFSPHPLPPLTFLRQQPALCPCPLEGGHRLPSGNPLPSPGGDQKEGGPQPGRGGGATLGLTEQGAGLPSSRAGGPCQLLPASTSQAPGHCARGPGLQHIPEFCPLHLGLTPLSLRARAAVPPGQQASRKVIREMRPAGPYQLRVEGPACYGVSSLVVKAVTQDHHHGKDLRHWAPSQGGCEPSSVGQPGAEVASRAPPR